MLGLWHHGVGGFTPSMIQGMSPHTKYCICMNKANFLYYCTNSMYYRYTTDS